MAINREKINKNAEKYIKAGRLENAIAEYLTLLKDNPKDWQVRNQVGDLYARLGKVRESVHHWTEMAEFYTQDGFILKAIAMYTKVKRIDPQNLGVMTKLAELYSKQGLVNESRNQYIELAEYYQRQNRITDALDTYRRLVELDRDNVKMRIKLAELYVKEKMLPQAVEEFTRVATELRNKGQTEECLLYLNRALDFDRSNSQALISVAQARLDFGQRDSAIVLLTEALKANPHDPGLLKYLGGLFLKEEDFNRAEQCFKRLVDVDPAESYNLLEMGQAFIKRNQLDRAFDLFDPAVDALVKQREGEKAVALMRSILNISPSHIPTLGKLVEIYSAFKQQSNLIAALSSLADAYYAIGQTQEALGVLQQVIDLDPENFQHRERLIKFKGEKEPPAPDEEEAQAPAQPSTAAAKEKGEVRVSATPVEPTVAQRAAPPKPAVPTMDEEGAAAEILECLTEADVFMRYKLYDKAQEQVANVLKIEPMNLHGHSILREIFEEKGWVAEAVKECMVLSEIYQDLKDDENARSVLADATRLDPNAPGLLDRMRSLERGQRMPPVTEPAKPAPPAPPQAPPPVEVIEEELEIDLAGLEEPVEEKQPAAEIGKIDLPQVAQPLIAKEGARIEPALPLSDDEEVEMPDIDLDFASFEDVVGIEGGLEEVEGVSVRALFGEIEEKEKKLPIPPPLTPPPAARPSVAKPPEIKQSPPPMTAAKPPEIKQPPPPIAVPKPPKIKHAPPPVAISKPSLVEEEMPELKELREAVASMDIHIESPQQARSAAPATPALPPTAKKPGRPPKASAAGVEPPAITPPPDRPSEPKPLTLDEVLIEDIPELEAIVRTVSKATPKAPPAPSRIPGPPLEDELPGDLISSLDEIEFIDEQRPAGAQLVAPFHPAELLVPGLDETFLQEEAIAPGAEEELTLDLNEKVEITAVSSSPVAAVPDERPAGDKEEFFDLSSELEAELLKAEEIRAASREEEIVTDESQAYQEKSLEELFTEFKKGIEKQLGTEDFDTRYNLGIAYKEMGLIDEAIGEFQIAARDPNKFLECCSLLGLCFMEKGMPKQAVSWLKKGIEMPGHRENEYQGLRYDLGLAYQQIGEYERAMEAFKDVFGYNANYRSVSDRIKETQDLLARSKGQ